MASTANDQKWPPKSPYEALLSSPGGRRKAQQRPERCSVSPSPSRRSPTKSLFGGPCAASNDGPIDAEEEDEETVQLQLAAIEARLRLKKLQAKKARAAPRDVNGEKELRRREASTPASTISRFESIGRSRSTADEASAGSGSVAQFQVPVSPERRPQPVQEAKSPGRVILGIDKGLTGKHVSLRKAPSMRTQTPVQPCEYKYPQTTRPKTFNERMAESRGEDKENEARRAKFERLRRQRSTDFGIKREDLDRYKKEPEDDSALRGSGYRSLRQNGAGFSREEILKAAYKTPTGLVHRKETVSGVRNSSHHIPSRNTPTSIAQPNSLRSKSSFPSRPSTSQALRSPPPTSSPDPFLDIANEPPSTALFDPNSSTHLTRRTLPEAFLARLLDGKTPQVIPDLLRTIKSPDYDLPPSLLESDFVVFGILASKSSPMSHKAYHHTTPAAGLTSTAEAMAADRNERGKYIVFTLTDLKWTIDLFLFGTAYTRFWKLTPGTLVAILNPNIMPPKHGQEDSGKFSLALNSGDETVLEVGLARDLGWCDAKRKDGKECGGWVNKRKTAFCEWHVEAKVERGKRGRMEVNSATSGSGRGSWAGGRGSGRGGRRGGKEDGLKREGVQWDRETQSKYYIAPGPAGGARRADSEHGTLSRGVFGLDADEDLERGGGKEERTRRRLATLEKERDVARKLGEGGKGTGAEYLRLRNKLSEGSSSSSTYKGSSATADRDAPEEVDAGSLGLLGNTAKVVQLSPLKRKYRALGGGEEGSAWKKTRFVTPRGIRVAGRESLGVGGGGEGDGDGDDDGLDIVMGVI